MKVANKPSGMGLGDEGKSVSDQTESVHMSKNASKQRLDKHEQDMNSSMPVSISSNCIEYVFYRRRESPANRC